MLDVDKQLCGIIDWGDSSPIVFREIKIQMTTDTSNSDDRPSNYNEKDDFIELAPYDDKWPESARVEIAALKNALPAEGVIDIQHVGSTAIIGCMAKPVIDIQIAVESLSAIQAQAIKAIEALGYVYWRGNPDKSHMLFIKGMPPFGVKRTHHVHIFEHNHPQWRDKLFFRDYLRDHPEAVAAYVELKQTLADKYRYDREAYTQGKTAFVQQILALRET
jgi:GrpB-like predicted nucleotidyltransferase (UPF0157 family)